MNFNKESRSSLQWFCILPLVGSADEWQVVPFWILCPCLIPRKCWK
jgi:hypothetical protein